MSANSPLNKAIAKNCIAFCNALRRLEQQLRSEEESEDIIDGILRAAAEFYGASRASIVEADWELGVGIITHEWCADGVEHQMDMLHDQYARFGESVSRRSRLLSQLWSWRYLSRALLQAHQSGISCCRRPDALHRRSGISFACVLCRCAGTERDQITAIPCRGVPRIQT